ncbi:MAG: ABC transporter permease [Pirellulales bacterium]|nr:ABC transporter permease [Pirellulales bacterium]
MKTPLQILPMLLMAVVGIAAWQLGVVLTGAAPILLPSPACVASAAWQARQELGQGLLTTTTAALGGLVASITVGSLMAIVFSQSRLLRASLYPYAVFLQTVPVVAIAPLLITWSGYQLRTVVLVAMIISLFPIISNVTTGLLSIDPSLQELFQVYRSNRWAMLRKLRIPCAVSSLIQGARVSSGLAVIGAIVGEFFVGNGSSYAGLGTLITGWQSQQKTPALIAAVIVSAVLGLLLFGLVHLVAATILKKWHTPHAT